MHSESMPRPQEQAKQAKKPELELIRSPEVERTIPRLSEEELEQICDLEVSEKAVEYMADRVDRLSPESYSALLQALAGRNIETELPIEKESFQWKRNVKECKRLQTSAATLLAGVDKKRSQEETDRLNRDVAKLMLLEQRKAEWLEQQYFPAVFERTINTAKGEVNQFLIRQGATAELESFRDSRGADIAMRDEISYLLDRNPPESAGVIRGSGVELRIPSDYTEKDEWKVYLMATHELTHYSSTNVGGKVGVRHHGEELQYEELNEAITQIVTYMIAKNHLEKYKTPLARERSQRLSLTDMPYQEYTVLLTQLFSKIPKEAFIDAMMNHKGFERLRKKFQTEFGDEEALADYGRRLRDFYLPQHMREQREREAKGDSNIIPFPSSEKES